MEITLTLREIMDKGLWYDFCKLKGDSVWCKIGIDEKVTLTEKEIAKLGFNKLFL